VSRRVVKSPRSDSPKFCFRDFCSIINTPIKKKTQHKTPWHPLFSSTCLQSQNFIKNTGHFRRRKGQLWDQISPVLFKFVSAYIYSFERFFCQLFNDVFEIWIQILVFEIRAKMQKKQGKKLWILWAEKKKCPNMSFNYPSFKKKI
jgi:hypothetical protein